MNTLNPIAEMGRFIAGSISLSRAKQRFAELLGWETAQDIQAEVVATQRKIATVAYAARVGVDEALSVMTAAQCPQSPGGKNITPCEAETIAKRISRERERMHNVSEMATV